MGFATQKRIRTMANTRFDYYQTLRKTHPDLYWNSKTQKTMQHEAKLLGNTFYTQYEFELTDVKYDQKHVR